MPQRGLGGAAVGGEVREVNLPGRGNGRCKGPEAGLSTKSEEASVAGTKGAGPEFRSVFSCFKGV